MALTEFGLSKLAYKHKVTLRLPVLTYLVLHQQPPFPIAFNMRQAIQWGKKIPQKTPKVPTQKKMLTEPSNCKYQQI